MKHGITRFLDSRTAVFLTVLLASFLFFMVSPMRTNALSGSEFDAGRIIDDTVFYNSATMSVSQIQEFLDSKVPNCDTNGSQPYAGTTRALYGAANGNPAPFTCLKDFSQSVPGVNNNSSSLCTGDISSGTKSAAQIIHDVGEACGINPQVLLVMLQKEQTLVTDDWPWDIQYNRAMGYACPDSGPNNSANCDSSFYGFFNQVYNAAQAFRRYEANPNSYNYKANRNNYIYYHQSLGACGGSTVFIENQATANLYIYTPYQPNQAALNNLYGTGDSCSAYGNRNFWRMFNDWFGSTRGTPFFKVVGDNRTYILGSDNNYYHVSSQAALEAYGFGRRFFYVDSVSSSIINGKTYSGPLPLYARFEDDHVFLIDRSGRYYFSSRSLVEDTYGFTWGNEAKLPESLAGYLPDSGNMRPIIKEYEGDDIFLMENGLRRKFVDGDAFNTGSPPYSSRQFVRLSSDFMASLPANDPILGDNKLIRAYNNGSFRFWDGSSLFQISRNTVEALGLTQDYNLSSLELDTYPTDPEAIINLVRGVDVYVGTYFVLNDGVKLQIGASKLSSYGLSENDFAVAPSNLLARIPTQPMSQFITIEGKNSKYLIRDGQRDHFDSRAAINEQGLGNTTPIKLNQTAASAFPRSEHEIISTNNLFKIQGQSPTYIINSSDSKIYIESSTMMQEYGFSSASLRTFDAGAVSLYPTVGTLQHITRDSSGNVWLVHSGGVKQYIAPSLLASGRFNIALGDIDRLSSAVYAQFTNGGPLKDLLLDASDGRIYYVENAQKRWITSPTALFNLGFDYDDISTVSASFIDSLPSGTNVN